MTLLRGWTTGDRPTAGGSPVHAVTPQDRGQMYPPRAGETLCGHYAHLDRLGRPFDPQDLSSGPICAACAAEFAIRNN